MSKTWTIWATSTQNLWHSNNDGSSCFIAACLHSFMSHHPENSPVGNNRCIFVKWHTSYGLTWSHMTQLRLQSWVGSRRRGQRSHRSPTQRNKSEDEAIQRGSWRFRFNLTGGSLSVWLCVCVCVRSCECWVVRFHIHVRPHMSVRVCVCVW